MRIPFISLVAAGALALGGCSYGGLGLGVGYGDPYYGGYGYGSPYGYGGSYYGSGYYGGSSYGYSPYGWYDNYYYPGSGYYVYDNNRHARVMTDRERAYWMARIRAARLSDGTTRSSRTVQNSENWSGFRNRAATRSSTEMSSDRSTTRTSVRSRNRDRSRDRNSD